MSEQIDPEFIDQLMTTVRIVETNSQLLLTELRAARQMAEQTAATLSLVVSLVGNAPDMAQASLVCRVANDLLTCAEQPDLAMRLAGCEPEAIDPDMLRSAAALLAGDDSVVLRGVVRQGAVH